MRKEKPRPAKASRSEILIGLILLATLVWIFAALFWR
jgi:hypothetical protein